MNVSAIIVTRGDVEIDPILESLPRDWEIVIWNNGMHQCHVRHVDETRERWMASEVHRVPDLSVYGRYAAIEYASHDLIWVQDDDVIVSDPQAIVDAWGSLDGWDHLRMNVRNPETGVTGTGYPQAVVANMPQEFRHEGYTDSCLVGFGACFHRDLPARAFDRFEAECGLTCFTDKGTTLEGDDLFGHGEPFQEVYERMKKVGRPVNMGWFHRTCDVVFTTLTPRVLVDVPKENLDYAYGEDRMWRQPDHVGERARMLELARRVRDGG